MVWMRSSVLLVLLLLFYSFLFLFLFSFFLFFACWLADLLGTYLLTCLFFNYFHL
ncbi:hypothetical protein F5X96DRAFT_630844 [Biscogniauxia mediterranea]|nr:hypothetical protein F5X96DRAFT_630844 [Biscogniauxia mediterranea]